jgi:hypothetical protein
MISIVSLISELYRDFYRDFYRILGVPSSLFVSNCLFLLVDSFSSLIDSRLQNQNIHTAVI